MKAIAPRYCGLPKSYNISTTTYPTPMGPAVIPAILSGDEVPLKNFFFDTKGREHNNCVHSKPVCSVERSMPALYARLSNGKLGCFAGDSISAGQNKLQSWWIERFEFEGRSYYMTVSINSYAPIKGNAVKGYTLDYAVHPKCYYYICRDSKGQGSVENWVYSPTIHTHTANGRRWFAVTTSRGGTVDLWEDLNVQLESRTKESIVQQYHDLCRSLESRLHDYLLTRFNESGGWSRETKYAVAETYVPDFKSSRKFFLFWEVEDFVEGWHGLFRGPIWYWRNWLVQHAYLDALQSFPTLNDNSISNILELVSFIKGIVVDHRIEIPKRLQDAWLSYRYVYNTTKMDVEQAISFVKRHIDLGDFAHEISCYGVSSYDVKVSDNEVVPVTCRCRIKVKEKNVDLLDKIWRGLSQYGLAPDFYLIWDTIPFSFVVDWLIPVGDALSVMDTDALFRGYYTISDVCFSLSYDRVGSDGYIHHQYTRWSQGPLAQLNGFYWFDKPKTSTKVISYRIADTISLITG